MVILRILAPSETPIGHCGNEERSRIAQHYLGIFRAVCRKKFVVVATLTWPGGAEAVPAFLERGVVQLPWHVQDA